MKIQAALGEINISDWRAEFPAQLRTPRSCRCGRALAISAIAQPRWNAPAVAAEKSVETWRKVHLAGIIANCLAGCLILTLALVITALWQAHAHYRDKLAAEINRLGLNEETQQKLNANPPRCLIACSQRFGFANW